MKILKSSNKHLIKLKERRRFKDTGIAVIKAIVEEIEKPENRRNLEHIRNVLIPKRLSSNFAEALAQVFEDKKLTITLEGKALVSH